MFGKPLIFSDPFGFWGASLLGWFEGCFFNHSEANGVEVDPKWIMLLRTQPKSCGRETSKTLKPSRWVADRKQGAPTIIRWKHLGLLPGWQFQGAKHGLSNKWPFKWSKWSKVYHWGIIIRILRPTLFEFISVLSTKIYNPFGSVFPIICALLPQDAGLFDAQHMANKNVWCPEYICSI